MDDPEALETEREPAGPPGVIVFEAATARRVGAQLRYGGGPHLDEIRYAVYRLTLAADDATRRPPPDPAPSFIHDNVPSRE